MERQNDMEQNNDQQVVIHSEKSSALVFFIETVKLVVIAFVIVVPIRYYLFQPFFVRGPSMESRLHNNDYLIVDKISYRISDPSRGDIIVFRPPTTQSDHFIKRIIGLPGETVQIENSEITIYNNENPDGFTLDEDGYLDASQRTKERVRITLGDTEYFVLGDNRLHSLDSRHWGVLSRDAITGRAWLRIFPFDQAGILKHITY